MVILLKNYYSSLYLYRIQLQFTLSIYRNSVFQHFSNVKQLVALVRLMGYIQLIGHV